MNHALALDTFSFRLTAHLKKICWDVSNKFQFGHMNFYKKIKKKTRAEVKKDIHTKLLSLGGGGDILTAPYLKYITI